MVKTNHIQVSVISAFLREQSIIFQQRYAFSYTITLHNQGQQAAKLLSRHWIITDANGNAQEVYGEGVIGEQPLIQPGNYFRYSSGTLLTTPVGSMQGTYMMRNTLGELFEATVPPFRLAMPELVH